MYFKAKIDRLIPFEQSPQMARGDRIHKELAAWMGGTGTVSEDCAKFDRLLKSLYALRWGADVPDIQTEQQWGFKENWTPTGWFAKDTWLRSILDVCVVYPDDTADVVDYKTGKQYDDNCDQMELFGLSVLCRYPAVSHVNTRLWYLDTGNEVIDQFTRADAEPLKAKWNARAAQMLGDETWIAKPNDKCKWCPLRRSAGGTCKFG
jgi:RecB family exonuclease